MKFVSEPSITTKIQKMNQRLRWHDPLIEKLGIDQTTFVLEDGKADEPEFSFMVIGDSGTGSHYTHNPQRQIAELMLEHQDDCRFVLHTGDVIYLVGSSEYYYHNFIEPYREFLVGGDRPKKLRYDKLVFKLPILPVLGNHDYYDLPLVFGVLSQATYPIRRLLSSKLDLDVGFHGSNQGDAFARAFLDYLVGISYPQALKQHLDRHYVAQGPHGRCLRYQPGAFTRLPNRYYTFRYGGIDFFALDSNTFNSPAPLTSDEQGSAYRIRLQQKQQEIEQQKTEIMGRLMTFNADNLEESEQFDDLKSKLEYLEEQSRDIEKQLECVELEVDEEQLDWLQQRLIESWQTESVRGRVIFFHHPPYVTEATKWNQGQTLAVRYQLRRVLHQVSKSIGDLPQGRPIVDLVLNGHAHCLEYLRTENTGHADSNINWIVCGGSGYSLRRQRSEGPELKTQITYGGEQKIGLGECDDGNRIGQSHLFVGRSGQGAYKRRPYSFVRIDVLAGHPPKFRVRPFVAERYRHDWINRTLDPFEIG